MKHIRVISKHRVDPIEWAECVSCAVSCQSACKTSATVGSSVCQNRGSGENKTRRAVSTRRA